jgi:hypothetical protein
MDETLPPSGATMPPLRCEQCGEPVWPNDSYRALRATDPESGETTVPRKVVHEGCWPEWAKAHDVADDN